MKPNGLPFYKRSPTEKAENTPEPFSDRASLDINVK